MSTEIAVDSCSAFFEDYCNVQDIRELKNQVTSIFSYLKDMEARNLMLEGNIVISLKVPFGLCYKHMVPNKAQEGELGDADSLSYLMTSNVGDASEDIREFDDAIVEVLVLMFRFFRNWCAYGVQFQHQLREADMLDEVILR